MTIDNRSQAHSAKVRANIARMLRPKSVAIAGVSQSPGSLGGRVLANLAGMKFTGAIHLVHPTRPEIDGRRCVPSTAALPDGVDCVVLAIPTAGVIDAVKGCAERGVGGVIIYSAGFAEAGPEGLARQQELQNVAIDAGLAVAGPNCLGHINFVDSISLTFGQTIARPPQKPCLGVVSQSGAMASVVRAALNARDLDLSYTMSTGNEAVNGVEDFLEFLLEEDNTRVIALIVEQFRHPRRFLELAARARAKGKPIVLLHPGRSQAARESAATHTGAMAGDYAVMKTLVTHAGVALAENMEELIDLTELMLRCPSVPKRGALIFGESGAFKALMLDVAEDIGFELPEPQGKSREVLAALAPGLILPTNPVDLTAQPLVDPGLYRRALTPLLADDHYDSIVLGLIVSTPSMARTKIGPVYETLRDVPTTKPVIFAMLGEDSEVPADLIADFRSVNVPFFRSPDRAMRALAAFTRYGAQRDAKGAAAATVPQGKRLPAGVIAEHAAKPLLAAAGITVPKSAMARTLTEAEAAAERIGYPVALKAQSAALSHKTDAGGVILRLGDKAALAEGWKRLEANIATAKPGLNSTACWWRRWLRPASRS